MWLDCFGGSIFSFFYQASPGPLGHLRSWETALHLFSLGGASQQRRCTSSHSVGSTTGSGTEACPPHCDVSLSEEDMQMHFRAGRATLPDWLQGAHTRCPWSARESSQLAADSTCMLWLMHPLQSAGQESLTSYRGCLHVPWTSLSGAHGTRHVGLHGWYVTAIR